MTEVPCRSPDRGPPHCKSRVLRLRALGSEDASSESQGYGGDEEERFYCFGAVDGGILTVRFAYRASVIRIIGAGYWHKGKVIYEREDQIHR